MGKKKRRKQQITNAPETTQPRPREANSWYMPRYIAGMHMDHDKAMRYSAVFACVRAIAEDIAALPKQTFLQQQDGTKQRRTSFIEGMIDKRANAEMSAMSFWETMIGWALTWGNGYAEIERDQANRPVALWPISPDRVQVDRDETTRALIYKVSNETGNQQVLLPDNVYHLHGLGYDGRVGYSVVSYAARSIGVGLAQDEFSASFFGNNTQLSGVFEHPGALSDQAYERLKKDWQDRHQGPSNAHKPAFLEEGMKWKTISVPPEDAQLIESKKHSVEDIARWFRVPPHKIGSLEKATFSNIEHQSIEYVQDALVPWIKRIEQECDYKLFSLRNSFFVKVNIKGLLRGDVASRSTFYREMFDRAVFSVDDIRELEDMNPVKYGDARFVPLNMQTLENAATAPPEPQSAAPNVEDDDGELFETIRQATATALAREQHRLKDAANRYRGDRIGFIHWCDNFYSQHREYMLDKFVPIFLNHGGFNGVDYTKAIENYIDYHLNLSRKYAMRVYDERIDEPDMGEELPHLVDELRLRISHG